MLGQLLVTLIVIALAAVYLRKRAQKQQKPDSKRQAVDAFINKARSGDAWQNGNRLAGAAPDYGQPAFASRFKLVLWSLLLIILLGGGIYSYLHWQDQQRLITVLLYRDSDQAPIIYRVQKRNLGEQSFVTDNGTRVTVSASERMEVIGL
jgi:TRAP-type C4-dicarboxylate transport system permease large subunit